MIDEKEHFLRLAFKVEAAFPGKALEDYCKKMQADKFREFTGFLAQFEPEQLTVQWREFVHQVDDLLNIVFGLTADESVVFDGLQLNPVNEREVAEFHAVFTALTKAFGIDTALRFKKLYEMMAHYQSERTLEEFSGESDKPFLHNLLTIEDTIAYFQQMRIYLTVLDPLIGLYAKGTRKLTDDELPCEFLPKLEHGLSAVTQCYFQLLKSRCYSDYELLTDGRTARSSKHTPNLDEGFLEPEVINLVEQFSFRLKPDAMTAAGYAPKPGVFDFEELAYSLQLMYDGYQFYKIDRLPAYHQLKTLVSELRNYVQQHYAIIVPQQKLQALQANLPALRLTLTPAAYEQLLYDYAPFREAGAYYYTTVPLLIRYIDRTLITQLRKVKRFQVHAGFTFENKVLHMLKFFGFQSQNVTRLKRAEFDVVTERNGVIYNFQCKNNFIDTFSIKQDWEAIGRQNNNLISKYEKALLKEEKREYLLQQKFPGQQICHLLVSRFPVIHENGRIINCNQLRAWAVNHVLGGRTIEETVDDLLEAEKFF